VLTRLDLASGPSRDAVVAEIAQNHLPHLDDRKDSNAGRLEDVTDFVIGLVERAAAGAMPACGQNDP
jgi:hypothetical protein